tara:strand:+ start:38 stop:853 length:816 start_codon:yes stop_codon:yes gene_type:complete
MKAIIIGAGSIGKRHSKNLNELGVETKTVDVDEIDNIDTILLEGTFDLGLVCSPNIYHIDHCIKLASNNIPIFCEKPFYSSDNRIGELLEIVNRNNLITMVGCNLRFSEQIKAIDPETRYISVYFGYDLRKWRPNSNHLESYSANKNLGGGVLLDVIHEIDYLYYVYGNIKNIKYTKDKLSNITNDTEDLVRGRIEFDCGTIADFTMNYLSEDYQRYYDILKDDNLRRVDVRVKDYHYKDEISYFIESIKTNSKCMNDFEEAHNLLKLITQ